MIGYRIVIRGMFSGVGDQFDHKVELGFFVCLLSSRLAFDGVVGKVETPFKHLAWDICECAEQDGRAFACALGGGEESAGNGGLGQRCAVVGTTERRTENASGVV